MSGSAGGEDAMALEGFGEIAEILRRSTVEVRSGKRGQGSGIIV